MKAMLEKSTEYDYEWVHKQFYEGRKFTHYGPDPRKNQSGPKGSSIPPLEQARRQKQKQKPSPTPGSQGGAPTETPGQAGTPGGTPAPGQAGTPGGTPAPGQTGTPEGTPAPGQTGTPEGTPAPGQAGTPGGTPAPGQTGTPEGTPAPGQAGTPEGTPAPGSPGATPETDPVPEEEPLTEIEDEGPNVEEAINVPPGFSENDIRIMAQAVYGEARGEPYIGQVAVAAVILNRINSPTFPNTPSGVIFEPRAFTAVADGQIYLEPNETARRAVLDAINGQDPSGNALYYFNPDTATSGWIWTRPQIKKIGKHIFCK
ncbi:cell wall hydrolase [Anaerobacillus sp. CMMVII]|uniref:cell wall hydrolase n=1 Tax=Anaerobacillus sp. CMMVII TaxID=2755588 RepID=UPI0021B79071|nr:cell wall hydrolase [Anaerobacillus sp. CMMVII]